MGGVNLIIRIQHVVESKLLSVFCFFNLGFYVSQEKIATKIYIFLS